MTEHIPAPLLWELTKNRSALTVKRRTGGGAEFSRDPLNLTNNHCRTQEGYVNDKAIGIQPAQKNGVTLITKKASAPHKPAGSLATTSFGSGTSSRKLYRSIVNSTAKKGYRADLRGSAVARASAIKKSQRPVKEGKPAKLRGAKARKAQEA